MERKDQKEGGYKERKKYIETYNEMKKEVNGNSGRGGREKKIQTKKVGGK